MAVKEESRTGALNTFSLGLLVAVAIGGVATLLFFWNQLLKPGELSSISLPIVAFIAGVAAMEGELRALGVVLHRGRTTAVVEADVNDSEGRRVARGLGTFIYLARKGEDADG